MEGAHTTADEGARRLRIATVSLAVGVLILLVKLVAAWVTGSAALFGDALESVVNVVAGLMVLLSVRWANSPADEDHPFGHGRIEALSAGVEGALLMAAAVGISWNAIRALVTPRELESMGLGLGLVAGTMVVNFVVGRILIRTGRSLHSLALEADGEHLRADAMTTLVMLLGLGLVPWTGWSWLDPAVALLLGAWVAYSGVRVVLGAVRFLMNEQRPGDVATLAEHLGRAQIPASRRPHALRILHGGRARYVYLRVCAPATWSLERADALANRVASIVREAYEGEVHAEVKVVPTVDPDEAAEKDRSWTADPDALIRER